MPSCVQKLRSLAPARVGKKKTQKNGNPVQGVSRVSDLACPGAGSPQGLLPGAPTDPDVHVKCIRFVTLWNIAVPHTTRSFRGDTLVRHGVLGVVPTPRPQRGTPFAPRGPEGPFPRFNATMGHCDFLTVLLAALRFLRLAIPWSVCVSSPFGRRRMADGSSWSLLYRLLPVRSSSRNCQDLPRSRETRAIIRHVPPTPV